MQRIHSARRGEEKEKEREGGNGKEEEGEEGNQRSEKQRGEKSQERESDGRVSLRREGRKAYVSVLCPLPPHICGIAISSADLRVGWKEFCGQQEGEEDLV